MTVRIKAMQLDVIVPTYNRERLLRLTLESLFAAHVPSGLEVTVTVVDNNSTDATSALVDRFKQRFGDRIRYLFESKQGRSHALNTGITSATGDLVGIIDDDEEIDVNWYDTVFEAFSGTNVDFIGGPYAPRWAVPIPDWFPQEYRAVVGWVDGGNEERPFDGNYPGILMGGNAVFKRSVFERVGLYRTWLGRTGTQLLAGEDEELYGRLLAAGTRGVYLPRLTIFHHIPAERVAKPYFRRWCFWRGVSLGLLDRTRRLPCAYLLGIPRWRHRKAAIGLWTVLTSAIAGRDNSSRAFTAELSLWDWLGLMYGRHFRNRRLSPGRTN
jgi:glucosyl-dolichyl phosphate glucuronosyltransferase